MISVVCGVHNESIEMVKGFVDNIRQYTPRFFNMNRDSVFLADRKVEFSKQFDVEIIVVDDGTKSSTYQQSNKDKEVYDKNISIYNDCGADQVIWNKEREGLGKAWDLGVAAAKYDNILLCGCDIRISGMDLLELALNEVDSMPTSLLCFRTYDGPGEPKCGADLVIFNKDRALFKCPWIDPKNEDINKRGDEWLYNEVPCVMGACYMIKKYWYEYIGGCEGHKEWGSLEPYISLKSWLFGGKCKMAVRKISENVYHIPRKEKTWDLHPEYVMYNRLMIANLLFNEEDAKELEQFCGHKYDEICKLVTGPILPKDHYKDKIVMSREDFCKKFNIKWGV